MLVEARVQPHPQGGRADITWAWQDAHGDRPAWQLVRALRVAPHAPEEGEPVVAAADVLVGDVPWADVRCVDVLARGGPGGRAFLQARVRLFISAGRPALLAVDAYDDSRGAWRRALEVVTRVERAPVVVPGWGTAAQWRFFRDPGSGDPEQPAGALVLMTQPAAPGQPDVLRWRARDGTFVDVRHNARAARQQRYDAATLRHDTHPVDLPGLAVLDHADPRAHMLQGARARSVHVEEQQDALTGARVQRVEVTDEGLPPETTVTYALWVNGALAWQGTTTTTATYGFVDRAYAMLPAVHQRSDEPTPEDLRARQGQLRRFMAVFGGGLDLLHGQARTLRHRHDLAHVRADALPHIAQWLGWPLDLTDDTLAQRQALAAAPHVYASVGTWPTLASMVTRATGWPCQVKEFVHNVVRTNAPEPIHAWSLWQAADAGTGFGAPSARTTTHTFDGRPALVEGPGGAVWRVWHRRTDAGRALLWQVGDGAALFAHAAAPDAAERAAASETDPALALHDGLVWLAWASRANATPGSPAQVLARPYDAGGPRGAPVVLSATPVNETAPALGVDGDGVLWAVWSSARRGRHELWARRYDGVAWGAVTRLTDAVVGHSRPAMARDSDGTLWLVFTTDDGGRRGLAAMTRRAGGNWSDGVPLAFDGGLPRTGIDDDAALALHDGVLRLAFSSDRDGPWRVYTSSYDAGRGVWRAPVTFLRGPNAHRDPALLSVGGALLLTWRSTQSGAQHQSRTLDTRNTAQRAALKTIADRAHYTYDTGRANSDWYARDTVGAYVSPPEGASAGQVAAGIARARGYVAPFVPTNVRLVWIVVGQDAATTREVINTLGRLDDSTWEDTVVGG